MTGLQVNPSLAGSRILWVEQAASTSYLRLRAIVHVDADPQVLLFVFTAALPAGDVRASAEGRLVWLTPAEVADPAMALLPDVRGLLAAIDALAPDEPPLSLATRW